MLWLVNRYSYLIFSTLAIGGAVLLGGRFGAPVGLALPLAVGGLLTAVQVRLRTASSAPEWRAVAAELAGGRPSLLFVYADT